MTAIAAEPARLEIGRVIQQLFAVLGRNFASFFILALLLSGVPAALFGMASLQNAATPGDLSNLGPMAGGLLVSLIGGLLLQGMLVYGTIRDLNGGRASLGESLSVGLRSILPLLGLGILMSLAVMAGFMLLVVPGVIMALAWSVAAPSLIAERTGVFGAFGRSAALTRGNRWRILGLFLLFVIASVVIGLVVGLLSVVGLVALGPTGVGLFTSVLVSPLSSAVSAVVGATGAAVLYVELRQVKEGASPESLAAIFD